VVGGGGGGGSASETRVIGRISAPSGRTADETAAVAFGWQRDTPLAATLHRLQIDLVRFADGTVAPRSPPSDCPSVRRT